MYFIKKISVFVLIFFLIILFFVSFFWYHYISTTTKDFPKGIVFDIKQGMTFSQISSLLEEEKIIDSINFFKIYDKIESYRTLDFSGIKSGKYIFEKELSPIEVYERLKKGESGIKDIKIIVMNGDSNFIIGERIKKGNKIKNFNKQVFLKLAEKEEGYLYPDTYFFSPYVNEKDIIKKMRKNFFKKTKIIKRKIENDKKDFYQILKIASLIENEAGNESDEIKKEVSGILWNRIKKEIPLQTDAVFSYIYKRHISRVLYVHLKIESPYNVYLNKGLPPTPIGNPTLKSIEAAANPAKTSNLFYLTGKNGIFYFAKTGRQHINNKNKYIINYRK